MNTVLHSDFFFHYKHILNIPCNNCVSSGRNGGGLPQKDLCLLECPTAELELLLGTPEPCRVWECEVGMRGKARKQGWWPLLFGPSQSLAVSR